MSIFSVDYKNRKPIWEQLTDNVTELVLRGLLPLGEAMPSVRAMAADLGINPNTIQKAYVELERRGVIVSIPGRGSFVTTDISALLTERLESAAAALGESARAAKEAGMERERAIKIIDEVWGNDK